MKKVVVNILNLATFEAIVNGSITGYPSITFYNVHEVHRRLLINVRCALERGEKLNNRYSIQVPLSDTHEKVYVFQVKEYWQDNKMIYVNLFYNGTQK